MEIDRDINYIDLNLEDGHVLYYSKFLNSTKSDWYFKHFSETIPWQLDKISVFGKTFNQPRLTSFYSENKKPLKYSNVIMQPHCFDRDFLNLKSHIENITQSKFNCCLLNLYRDGTDSNGWHADDEKQLGKNPIIASLSFGAERVFHLKHKTKPTLKKRLLLQHGSLLVMKDSTQHHWLHQLPKTQKKIKSRINLTFRLIR